MSGPALRTDRRGMSSLVGVLLLIAVLFVAVTSIWAGVQATASSQGQTAQVEAVSEDFKRLAAETTTVATGQARTRVVALETSARGSGGQTDILSSTGRITVDVVGSSGTELDTALGTVQFRQDDATVAVQGGGVWRASESSAPSMVSAPPITTTTTGTGKSVTVSVVRLTGSGTIDDRAGLARTGERAVYPQVYVPADESLEIRIESAYATAWARYFRSEFPSSVTSVSVSRPTSGPATVQVSYDPSDGFYLHAAVHTVAVSDR